MPERSAAGRRGWAVPAAVFSVGIGSWLLYNHAPPAAANAVIVPYTASLLLGPLLVHTSIRSHGGPVSHAVGWGMSVPFLGLAKKSWCVTGVFSAGEAAYYALNPISLGIFTAAAAPIAAAELVFRRRASGHWPLASGPGMTLFCVLLMAVGAAIVGRESGGREIFYGYIALYRVLFPGS